MSAALMSRALVFMRRFRIFCRLLVMPKSQALLIAIPRTASTSVEHVVKNHPLSRVHFVGHYRRLELPKLRSSTVAATIRSPAGWYRSNLAHAKNMRQGKLNPLLLTAKRIRSIELDSIMTDWQLISEGEESCPHLKCVYWERDFSDYWRFLTSTGFGLYSFVLIYFLGNRETQLIDSEEQVCLELDWISQNTTFIRTECLAGDLGKLLDVSSLKIPVLGAVTQTASCQTPRAELQPGNPIMDKETLVYEKLSGNC